MAPTLPCGRTLDDRHEEALADANTRKRKDRHMSSRVGHLHRCGAVWAAATVAAVATVAWLLPGLQGAVRAAGTGRLASHPFEDLLVWLCSAAALVATCWLWAVTTLVTLAAARGRAGAGLLGVPDAVRRGVLAACGVALVGGIGAPALATP